MIGHYLAILNPRYAFRDSGTGRFVTRVYAALNPKTTYRDRLS